MLSSYTFMCITNVVLLRSTVTSVPSFLLQMPILSEAWSAHHSLSPVREKKAEACGSVPYPLLPQLRWAEEFGKGQETGRGVPLWQPSPMMARAVALLSWLRTDSITSRLLPSRSHLLMVPLPELIQYSLLSG